MSAAIGSSGLAMATSLTAALSFAVMSVGGEAHTREHSSRAGLPGVLCEPGVRALCGGKHTVLSEVGDHAAHAGGIARAVAVPGQG